MIQEDQGTARSGTVCVVPASKVPAEQRVCTYGKAALFALLGSLAPPFQIHSFPIWLSCGSCVLSSAGNGFGDINRCSAFHLWISKCLANNEVCFASLGWRRHTQCFATAKD